MNAVVSSRAFQAGNSVAVRLPKGFGIAAGDALEIEQTARGIWIREKHDPEDVRRRWLQALGEIDALPKPGAAQAREPWPFRDD